MQGKWVKLGWAYNKQLSEPQEDRANEKAVDQSLARLTNVELLVELNASSNKGLL